MEPRAVWQHAAPAYPTRREFLAAAAAALAAAGISGCGSESSASAQVAPIFEHGEGRGAMGCVVLTPPEFLSEEEALQVVREELAKAGVTLGQGMPLPDVTVEYEDPDARLMASGDNWLGEPVTTVAHAADLAAVDRQRRVGVAVVTSRDCDRFRGCFVCSVSSYDTKGLAQSVADALRKQAKQDLRVGVFYDPLEKWDFAEQIDAAPSESEPEDIETRFEKMAQSVSERARAQLRQQAQDFVAWLKKLKAIP
jgi:hypothetical protein